MVELDLDHVRIY